MKKNEKNIEQCASFETTLTKLEQIVTRLEAGTLPLDQAIHEFEQGVKLARQGQKTLQQAEQWVQILLSDNPDAPLASFSPEGKTHDRS